MGVFNAFARRIRHIDRQQNLPRRVKRGSASLTRRAGVRKRSNLVLTKYHLALYPPAQLSQKTTRFSHCPKAVGRGCRSWSSRRGIDETSSLVDRVRSFGGRTARTLVWAIGVWPAGFENISAVGDYRQRQVAIH